MSPWTQERNPISLINGLETNMFGEFYAKLDLGDRLYHVNVNHLTEQRITWAGNMMED